MASTGGEQLLDLVKARTSLECGESRPQLYIPLRLTPWLERLPAGKSVPASVETPAYHRELEDSHEAVEEQLHLWRSE